MGPSIRVGPSCSAKGEDAAESEGEGGSSVEEVVTKMLWCLTRSDMSIPSPSNSICPQLQLKDGWLRSLAMREVAGAEEGEVDCTPTTGETTLTADGANGMAGCGDTWADEGIGC